MRSEKKLKEIPLGKEDIYPFGKGLKEIEAGNKKGLMKIHQARWKSC